MGSIINKNAKSLMSGNGWWVLTGVGITALIICIDFTIVNTVLATIQLNLNATIGQLQWIMAGFGLLFCTFLVTMGRLGDLIGRRLLLYIGIIGFGIASLGAGLSQTANQLIFFRILQGAFGAIVFPCGIAIISDVFPKHEHGKALGIYGSILGIGLAVGPVLGGFIVQFFSWRWVFLINIPIIIVSFIICIPTIRESKLSENQPIDWWGFLLVTLFVAGLVYAINQSPIYGWTSSFIIFPLIISLISFILLLILESKIAYPLIPLNLFMNRSFSLSTIVFMTSVSFAWAVVFIVPLYLHTVLDKDPGMVGLLMLPMTFMTALFPTWAGRYLDKWGTSTMVILMFIFLFIGFAMQLTLNENYNLLLILIAFISYGIAWGIGNGIGTPIALARTETSENSGLISGAAITILNIVGVLSLSVGITLFRHVEQFQLIHRLEKKNYSLTAIQLENIRSLLSDPEKASQYLKVFGAHSQEVISIFKSAFVHGYHLMIIIFLVLTLLGFISSLYLLKDFDKKS